MAYYDRVKIEELVGKVLTSVTSSDDEVLFTCEDGTKYKLYHDQDCCENVSIDNINGDLEDLVGSPITLADERTSTERQPWEPEKGKYDYDDSFTWTFYSFATVKGYVDIRWYGSSNGYYSESVDFEKVK